MAQVGEILEALRATGGVVAAGAGNMAPLSRATAISQFTLPLPGPDGEPAVARAVSYVVTPGYTEALSMNLREGRWFRDADLTAAGQPMLVNEAFVRAYLTDGKPAVGRQMGQPSEEEPVPPEIVGVVANVLRDGLDDVPQPAIYTLPQPDARTFGSFSLLVRTAGEPQALVGTLREAVRQAEPGALVDVATLSSQVSASLAQPRFAAATLGVFALLALVLAATGLYGVLSYSVSRRVREMGIRSALGAGHGSLVRLVMRQGLAVCAVGLLLGLAGAALLTRWLESQLFGVSPLDPLAFAAAPLALLAVAALACWLPARRAASVEPTEALRAE